jgi:pimeloyl-ACP methyl ester carboxylesterase
MRKVRTLLVLGASLIAASALAAVHPFPSAFKTQFIAVNGARIYVRVGGHGPAVVLLHGYGMMATVARAGATNVQSAVIPASGHWLMEEQPQATVAVVVDFLR